MKLTDEQRKILIEKINQITSIKECNLCGSKEWSAADTIFELREFNQGSLVIGGNQSIYPVLPLTCLKCGNTFFLNPIKLGLINPQQKEVEDKNEQ